MKYNYPNIIQSLGITEIVLVGMLVFSPVSTVLNQFVGREASMLIYYILAMGIPFWIVTAIRKKKTKRCPFNFRIENKDVIPFLIVGTVALLFGILTPISSLIPIPQSIKQTLIAFGSQTGIFAFIVMVIAAPILEELIFRGIILEGLLNNYTPTKAILISSLLFGLVHLNPWQFVAGFIIGIFSGWVYYKTRSISLCIIIHASANLSGYLVRCFVNVESTINNTLVQTYGGVTNLILSILGSTLIILICIYFLKKKLFEVEKY